VRIGARLSYGRLHSLAQWRADAMKLRGTVRASTDIAELVQPLDGDPRGSSTPLRNARVVLAMAYPLRLADGGYFPAVSVTDTTGPHGRFVLDIPESEPLRQAEAFLTVHERDDGARAHETYRPVYRSERFSLAELAGGPTHIVVVKGVGATADGISQPEVSAQAREVVQGFDEVDSLVARITRQGLAVTGEGAGAPVGFDLTLAPSTSVDLDELLRSSVASTDPPVGPPASASETPLAAEIRKRVGEMAMTTSEQLTDAIVARIADTRPGLSEAGVHERVASQGSLTAWRVRFPRVGSRDRAIVADPVWGFPRRLT
ncbi:MAG: hypothetical protein AAF211_23085, partial [Myxococcota bacterium]